MSSPQKDHLSLIFWMLTFLGCILSASGYLLYRCGSVKNRLTDLQMLGYSWLRTSAVGLWNRRRACAEATRHVGCSQPMAEQSWNTKAMSSWETRNPLTTDLGLGTRHPLCLNSLGLHGCLRLFLPNLSFFLPSSTRSPTKLFQHHSLTAPPIPSSTFPMFPLGSVLLLLLPEPELTQKVFTESLSILVLVS